MNKKYQIFISSTYKDLIAEREKVRDVILSMYQFPIGMEMFSAADEEQWEIIKETIDSSDYYILIIGKRYGSIIDKGPDKGISYTEKEYRYAKSIGLPILAYIKNDEAITANNVDDDPEKLKRLQVFKDDVTTGREVKWFGTIDQLGTEVTLSLYKEMSRKKRPGWIRNDAVDIEKNLSEIVELSKKNRELQEQNTQLSKELEKLRSASDRKPLLSLTLGVTKAEDDEKYPEFYDRNELITIDQDGTVQLKLKQISTALQKDAYRPYSRKDIPQDIQSFISDQEIQEYNEALPSKEVLDEYLQQYLVYQRLKENGIPVTFFVNNIGTAKATDISVTIEFPAQIQIINLNEVVNLSEPKAPEMPTDIIKKAYKKAERHTASVLDMVIPSISEFDSICRINDISSIHFMNGNTIYSSIEIEENIVEIENKKGIVHTKFDYFYGGYIIPFALGKFEAKVTLMCAEYEDPEEYFIRFIVEE